MSNPSPTHRPVTQSDKRLAFIRTVHTTSGAKDRWQARAKTGLTDEELKRALAYELGIAGGCSGYDDCPAIAYQAAGLKIWASWDSVNAYSDSPVLEGEHTIRMARQVLNILNPDDKQMSLL